VRSYEVFCFLCGEPDGQSRADQSDLTNRQKYNGREGEPGHLEKGEISLEFLGGNLLLERCINGANYPQGY
jgi:hypothetical protein